MIAHMSEQMEQVVVGLALLGAMILFAWGRWRYDLVALLVLITLVLLRIVPAEEAFLGFAHPAVITVAAVLVASTGLKNSGLVDVLGAQIGRLGDSVIVHATALTALVAFASAFMNNVGALAILMPVAIGLARSSGRSPSQLLMPLAFGSLLGGMMTLIGTPPNLIISAFRAEAVGAPLRMFDFAPVGLAVTIVGVALCGLIGWWMMPARSPGTSREDLFEIDEYVAEVGIGEKCKAVGLTIGELVEKSEGEVTVVGLSRAKRRLRMPASSQQLDAGDVLVVEGEAEAIAELVSELGLSVEGDRELRNEFLKSDDIVLTEAIVQAGAIVEGRSATDLALRRRYGVNLLGVARQGKRIHRRLRNIRLQAGDVLLLQGDSDLLPETISRLGCLPLAERGLRMGQPKRIVQAITIFAAAIVAAVVGIVPIEVAFTAAACLMVLVKLVRVREMYNGIDWPVIILLGAMLPVGRAMETTGAAATVAELMLRVATGIPPWAAIALHMATCMALSNVVNNAAAAVLMAPIAVALALGLGVSVDPFLMATAVGASAAFLTPIGHQSNTLVMGPGGYRFLDYLRLGIPLSLLTLVVGTIAIGWWWPMDAT